MRHTARLAVALTIALWSGCAGIHPSSVPHCVTPEERADTRAIYEQWGVAKMSGDYENLMDYADQLSAYCLSINAARGDKK